MEMTPKYSPFLWWPQKNIHKIFIPQKILIFLKTPQKIEIQNFEPKKMTRSFVYMKISEYPPPPPICPNDNNQNLFTCLLYFWMEESWLDPLISAEKTWFLQTLEDMQNNTGFCKTTTKQRS